MQYKSKSKSNPGKLPTFSGLLGPTITEMGINFALEILFRISEPVFVFFFRSLNKFLPQCSL